jgi:thiosulfate dehydrogenase [quinone] large subunit
MTTTAKGDLSVTQASQGSWYHGFTQAASTKYWAAIARISLGIVFLWAFLDKNFGLGFTTPSEEAWNFALGDGSPTWGYLTFGINPEGQLASFFNTLGESAGVLGEQGPTLYPGSWVNWLFMLGLLGIGVALLLGVFMRIGSISGVVMLLMMYLAAAPWAQYANEAGEKQSHNPIVDEHLVYAIVLVVLMLFTAERTWGLGKWWQSTSIVQRFPWLA